MGLTFVGLVLANALAGAQPGALDRPHALTPREVRTLVPGAISRPVREVPDPTGYRLFGRDETGIRERLREVVTTETRWAALWREVNGPDVSPNLPPAPAVDFAREAVVVASLGERANAGWRIAIAGAALRHDTLFVVVRTDMGAGSCHEDNAVSPVAAGRVRRAGVNTIRFIEISRDLKRCG